MERKISLTQEFKGIWNAQDSAFTDPYHFSVLNNCRFDTGSLRKLHRPGSIMRDGLGAYVALGLAGGRKLRGCTFSDNAYNNLIFFWGDIASWVPVYQSSDRISSTASSGTAIWSGKGDNNSQNYKTEKFLNGTAGETLVFCAGGLALEWIRLQAYLGTGATTGTVAVLPTTGCTAVAAKDGRLWAAFGDKLFYSSINDGLTFSATDFLRLFYNDTVCEIKVFGNMMYVFTTKGIYYITGNSTSDYEVKFLENTSCVVNSIFDVSYRGVYFIDKDCNFRFIGTNPYYQSTANSIIISEKLNFSENILSGNLQYLIKADVAYNNKRAYFNFKLNPKASDTNYAVDCTKYSSNDFTKFPTPWNGYNYDNTVGVRDFNKLSLGIQATGQQTYLAALTAGNRDLYFELNCTGARGGSFGITSDPATGLTTNGVYFKIDSTTFNSTININGTSTAVATPNTAGKKYIRIRITNKGKSGYSSTECDVEIWHKTVYPGDSWGSPTVTALKQDFNFAWYFIICVEVSKASEEIKNLLISQWYVTGASTTYSIFPIVKNDIHTYVMDEKNGEFYKLDDTATFIEYMTKSTEQFLNNDKYMTVMYTDEKENIDTGHQFIGSISDNTTTYDSMLLYGLSTPFDLGTSNIKILRRIFIDVYPKITTGAGYTVYLYLQNEEDFAITPTSVMTLRNGWNTIPKTFRSRRFKWGISTDVSTEFVFKNIQFEFDDLGEVAF